MSIASMQMTFCSSGTVHKWIAATGWQFSIDARRFMHRREASQGCHCERGCHIIRRLILVLYSHSKALFCARYPPQAHAAWYRDACSERLFAPKLWRTWSSYDNREESPMCNIWVQRWIQEWSFWTTQNA